MKLAKLAFPIQRTLIAINAIQLTYMAYSYFNSTLSNKFPILEGLFKTDVANVCTVSGCWQSIVPFLGSTYLSIAFISVLALFFRTGRELTLMIIGLASVHIFMAIIRLTIAPSQLYLDNAAIEASSMQFIVGILLLASAALPNAIINDKKIPV